MRAVVKRTGIIVWVTRNKDGQYIDKNNVIYNSEDLSFLHEVYEHRQDVRERAAIAAMQGTITLLGSSDRAAFRDIVVEGFSGSKRTFPNEIAEFAVACADALVEQLEKGQE